MRREEEVLFLPLSRKFRSSIRPNGDLVCNVFEFQCKQKKERKKEVSIQSDGNENYLGMRLRTIKIRR